MKNSYSLKSSLNIEKIKMHAKVMQTWKCLKSKEKFNDHGKTPQAWESSIIMEKFYKH